MTIAGLERRIAEVIAEYGPQTGAGLREHLGAEHAVEQWRICLSSPCLLISRIGRRYLRLDESVEGYGRLSPSILREFLTYSVVGLASDPASHAGAVGQLAALIEDITAEKRRLAQRVAEDAMERLTPEELEKDQVAILVAGDIVYHMAHDAPRPERSTGQMVRGSDLDLVVLLDDAAPESMEARLDEAIFRQKHRLLINPSLRQEVDYAIKRLALAREQMRFDDLKRMIACKIMDEAELIAGSESLYLRMKNLLEQAAIPDKLRQIEMMAILQRRATEQRLLQQEGESLDRSDLSVFCGTEELPEFE